MKINFKNQAYFSRIAIILTLLFILPGKMLFAQKKNKAEVTKGEYKGYNLLMISINNIGTEHMSLYGYKRKTTPYLDRWASDAAVFENFFSPASWTLPATTSLFTSLYPYTHKVIHRYKTNLLDENIKTLPEVLKENNYKTAAFTGGLDYYKDFGHMQGFEYTIDNPNFSGFEVTLSQAKTWLSENLNNKFFLFIQGYDAHAPFTPPPEFKGVFSDPKGKNITVDTRFCLRGIKNSESKYVAHYIPQDDPFAGTQPKKRRKPTKLPVPKEKEVLLTQDDIEYLRDLYDEEVLYVDNMVGNFLSSLSKEVLDKTIIIIYSEHGEMFAKHGRFGRAGAIRGTLYDEVVHVPLIIKFPQGCNKKISGLVQIIDIMPSVLDFLDIPFFQKIQGKSLLPLFNDSEPINEYVYAGLPYNAESKDVEKSIARFFYPTKSINESIRNFNWKLLREVNFLDPIIHFGKQTEEKFELYNLQDDPEELKNVFDDYPKVAEDLKGKLNNWAVWSKQFALYQPTDIEIPEKLIRDAKEHGYW